MPGSTTRGFPYPNGSELLSQGDDTIRLLAERCRDEYSEGTFASRPAASTATAGRIYYATDTGDYWRDTGSGWRFERDTARCLAATGTAVDTSSGSVVALTLGSITEETVSGRFALSSGTAVSVTDSGLYLIKARWSASGTAFASAMAWLRAGGVDTGIPVGAQDHIQRLTGGQTVGVVAQLTSGGAGAQTATCSMLYIERLGP